MSLDRMHVGRAFALAGAILGLALSGCTPAESPAATTSPAASSAVASPTPRSASPAPSTAASSPPAESTPPAATGLQIDVTIDGHSVSPSGKKINVEVGDTVTLHVTSDMADAIHAHTGGDGFELEVSAGKKTTGSFTITEPGSFEVESHHLEKTIVILNAR